MHPIRAVTATEEGGVIRLRGHSADQQAIVENSGTLDASGSTHGRPERQIVSYSWDFGDGNSYSESIDFARQGRSDATTRYDGEAWIPES